MLAPYCKVIKHGVNVQLSVDLYQYSLHSIVNNDFCHLY